MLWSSGLSGKYFLASTCLITKLIDMTGLDDFSKVTVSIHSFAVYFIKIATAGLIEFYLCRKNSVFHTGNRLIIILFFHDITTFLNPEFVNPATKICQHLMNPQQPISENSEKPNDL